MIDVDSQYLEELISAIMRKTGVGRLVAFQLARLAIEYRKPRHGKWRDNS